MAPIRVGTAGWIYDDWNGIVYPASAPRGFDKLALMASLFDTNEINSTFYRIPPPRQTADWSRRVAHNPRFAFTAKLYRGFTHERKAGAAEEMEFSKAIAPLRDSGRLGAVLVQFPMSFHDTAENRRALEGILRRFAAFPLAAEFRHASWNTRGTLDLLSGLGTAFVNIDQPRISDNLPGTAHVTAPIAYYRFHGRNAEKWFGPETSNEERYNYLYSEKELEPWAEKIRKAAENTLAKKGVYAILNNHFRGQAVANALQLQNMLIGETRSVPETLRDTYAAIAPITTPAASRSRQKSLF